MEVVHSLATRPLSSFDGKSWYLTYDQHLGQVLNRLTRLVLSEVDRDVADRYLEKLFAQRLAVAGQFVAALAMSKPWLGSTPPPPETSAQLKRRSLLVHAQEAFVIGHEMTHVLLGQVPALRDELADELFMLLKVEQATPEATDQEAFEEYWDSSVRAALQRYGLTPSKERYRGLWNPPAGAVEALSSDAALLEECICDYVGSVAGAMASVRLGRSLPTEAFVASGIALHNLRLLQQLDRYASGTEGDERDATFQESVTRLSVHRTAIRVFCTSMSDSLPLDAAKVVRDTVAFNKSFSAIIGDPVLFVLRFDEFVDHVEREAQARNPGHAERPWSRQQRAFLRAQLGFGSGAFIREAKGEC